MEKNNIEPIKKLNPESLTSIVYNDLKGRILSGEYKAGEKLPSENSLTQLYGVSRVTIRSVLQKLNNLGLVEVKIGEGTFVKEISFLNILSEVSELVAYDSMLNYLEEFRIYIEKACTELAIKNATKKEINKLREISQTLLKCALQGDFEGFAKNDFKFHYNIAISSHNKLFELVYSSIKDIFYKCINANITNIQKSDINYLVDSANAHARLVDAIENKNIIKSLDIIGVIVSHFDHNDSKLNEV